MKQHLPGAIIIAVFTVIILPFSTQAQETDREIYLRPSFWRPYDQRGINVFETTKMEDTIPFTGPRVRFGAGFTQQFQNLSAENPGALNNGGSSVATAGGNKLYPLNPGFLTAMATLYTDIGLGDGIRLNLTTYLSSRHHNEAWVKGGYIQFDKLPFKGQFWTDLMEVTTIKVGHMEINYGDAHFRRSDAGHALYNPFMESYIMDAFTTEIGGEVFIQKNGIFGMAAISNGMIKGNVDTAIITEQDQNNNVNPSLYFKAGIDKNIQENLRVRLSGSYYTNSSSPGLTLYGGDRAGSHYQNVMERWVTGALTPGAAVSSSTSIAFSGRFNPGFSKKLNAYMVNGFLKAYGLELFGTYEHAKGRSRNESTERKASQYAIEGIYRMGPSENVYLGTRYNSVDARLTGTTSDVHINRLAFAAGWFVTKNLLLKGEYVTQKYKDFPVTDFRSGGKFDGYVIEAVVGF